MILKEVRLFPFGAIRDREYRFKRGLNVILGPNEAGKSTLVNAIFAALFLPPDLRRSSPDWKNFLVRYLPYPEGDTARVSLCFEDDAGRSYRYTCAWGEEKEARLVLENGEEINNPGRIQEILQQHLGPGRGTYQGVLFTRQDELAATVERLKDNPEVAQTLGEILRSALFEAGGVSLEELEARILQEKKQLLENWDLERWAPPRGRDVDNPYSRGVGQVLGAYYAAENLRRDLDQARKAEERVERLSAELREALGEQERLRRQLEVMERQGEEVRRRSVLEPRREALLELEKQFKKVMADWPRAQERAAHLEQELAKSRERLELLARELAEAREVIAAREKRALLKEVRPLVKKIEEIEAELAQLPPIAKEDLRALESSYRELARLRATLEGMKLTVRLQTREPLNLKVTSGLEQEEELAVEREASFSGDGRLVLESPTWSLEVQSGEGDVDRLMEKAAAFRKDYQEKLAALQVPDLETAREMVEKRDAAAGELERLQERLASLLKGSTPEELEAQAASLAEDKPVRDPAAVEQESTDLKIHRQGLEKDLEQVRRQLEQWAEEHGSLEQLLDRMADLKGELKETERDLERLAPLPEGYADAEDFLDKMKALKEEVQLCSEKVMKKKEELSSAERDLPEESSEELAAQLRSQEERLQRLQDKARALLVVQEEFAQLKDELDRDTFLPLIREFARYLAPVTGQRYRGGQLEGALPRAVTAADGTELPLDLLSTGTAGGVALALRLAMAGYLLGGSGGFMVMDDPLVDFAPQRRAEAARILAEFAAERQLLLTTCDPATARLLGGNLIPLEPAREE